MTGRHDYPAGVPCWIDLETADPEMAMRFYGGVLGWQFVDSDPPGSAGRYFVARLDGKDMAGIALRSPAQAVWNMYVTVDDLDAALDRVAAAGGRLSEGPAKLPGASRVTACVDAGGAPFRLWEPRGHHGAQTVNVPGAWNFNELNTSDPTVSSAFYAALFGWQSDPVDFGDQQAWMLRRPGYGDFLAQFEPGIRERQAEQGVPPGFEDAVAWMQPLHEEGAADHWTTSFSIDDADAAAERAARLGGTVVVPPFDAGPGIRVSVLADPGGATFSVTRYAP